MLKILQLLKELKRKIISLSTLFYIIAIRLRGRKVRRLIDGNRQSETESEMIEFKFHYRSWYDLDDSIVERTQLSSTRGAILFTTVGKLELRLTFKTQMYLGPRPPKSNKFKWILLLALSTFPSGVVKSSLELSILEFSSVFVGSRWNNWFVIICPAPKLPRYPKISAFRDSQSLLRVINSDLYSL